MAASTSPTWPLDGIGRPDSRGTIAATSRSSAGPVVRIHFHEQAQACLAAHAGENHGYWRGVLEEGSAAFAPNLRTRPGIVAFDGEVWPVTVNDAVEDNSYPCSLHTQYVRYPRAQLALVPTPAQRLAARAGLVVMDALLRIAQADRVVQWSSWLYSTNLHASATAGAVGPVTAALAAAFPRHAVLLKNVHDADATGLPEALVRAGYQLITSRQVYLFDGRMKDFTQKSTVKRDLKELRQLTSHHVVEHDAFTEEDVPRITELYQQLYVEKHSRLNPRYTRRFVSRALTGRWLEFRGLRHVSGRLDGVYGCFTHGGVTSTPFIGHDTTLPTDLGLYRHLVSMLLQRVAERGLLLNYSSGAGDFKRRRGGRPVIEHNAVHTAHLPKVRQAAFRLLGGLVDRVGRRFLEENQI